MNRFSTRPSHDDPKSTLTKMTTLRGYDKDDDASDWAIADTWQRDFCCMRASTEHCEQHVVIVTLGDGADQINRPLALPKKTCCETFELVLAASRRWIRLETWKRLNCSVLVYDSNGNSEWIDDQSKVCGLSSSLSQVKAWRRLPALIRWAKMRERESVCFLAQTLRVTAFERQLHYFHSVPLHTHMTPANPQQIAFTAARSQWRHTEKFFEINLSTSELLHVEKEEWEEKMNQESMQCVEKVHCFSCTSMKILNIQNSNERKTTEENLYRNYSFSPCHAENCHEPGNVRSTESRPSSDWHRHEPT